MYGSNHGHDPPFVDFSSEDIIFVFHVLYAVFLDSSFELTHE